MPVTQTEMTVAAQLEKGIVLIADDNQSNREMCGINLESEGFETYFAKDGKECLDIAKEISPDVILLDVVMPVMDGYQVLEKLRQDPATRETPVLMLTVKSGSKDIVKALKMGAYDYLKKPFEMDELIERINKLVRLRRIMSSLGQLSENLNERVGYLELELKKGSEEKSKLKKYLVRNQEMETLATLAKGIAHDFNNIIFLIMGYIDMTLFNLSGDSESADNLEKAMQAAKRAKQLVSPIFALSGTESQKTMPVKIQSIIHETLEIMKSTLPPGISVITDIDATCSSVMCTPSHIYQIFISLCMNAWNEMPEKCGTIDVGLNELEVESGQQLVNHKPPPGKYIRLTVVGTKCETVGEPMEKSWVGTEIGLSIVADIVKACNGVMTTESGPGRTAFRVFLPVQDDFYEAVSLS